MGTSLKQALDLANLNTLQAALSKLGLGSILAGLMKHMKVKQVPAAGSYDLATVQVVALPAEQKAISVIRAYARAGGVTGPLTPVAYGTTPATGQVGVSPCGNISVLAADAITSLDVIFEGMPGEVIEYTADVASNSLALPANITNRGVVMLVEAEATVGTSTGVKKILVAGGAPAAGQAALNTAMTSVAFQATDAVTKARVKVLVAPTTEVHAALAADTTTY